MIEHILYLIVGSWVVHWGMILFFIYPMGDYKWNVKDLIPFHYLMRTYTGMITNLVESMQGVLK